MATLLLDSRPPFEPPIEDGFEVGFVTDDGAAHRVPLGQAWAYANGTAGSSANTVAAAPSAASAAEPAMTPAGGSPPLVASTSRATAAAARRSSTTPWYMRFWQDIPAPTPEPAWPARGD